MSKKLYIGIYATSFGLCFLTTLALSAMYYCGTIQKNDTEAMIYVVRIEIYVFLQLVIVHAVYHFLLLYHLWRAIQDGQTTVTVGKAVGYSFIPIFNIYWIFRVWANFPLEYNNYIDRYGLPVEPLAGKWFKVYPLVLLLAIISLAPLVAVPLIFMAVIGNAFDALKALKDAVSERRSQLSANQIPEHLI